MAATSSRYGRSPIALPIIALLLIACWPSAMADVPGYKKRIVRDVFDKLVEAIRDDSSSHPQLKVTNEGSTLAGHRAADGMVIIHERLYDLCTTFGADSLNALAALLAHELAHHYLKHDVIGAVRPKVHSAVRKRFPPEQLLKEEGAADIFGGFYSRLAGFNALDLTPLLLERLYRLDGIVADSPFHLKLDERKEVAWSVEGRLQQLIATFEGAKYLTLIKRYGDAEACYDRLIAEFPSRELFNNAGVALGLHALSLIGGEDARFIYPLELDADTRLRGVEVEGGSINRSTRSPDPADSALIVRLLDSAKVRFESAIQRDPRYAPAVINLATIQVLRHQYDSAIALARKAKKLDATPRVAVLASTIESIALARRGEGAAALRLLSALEDAADLEDLVETNLAVLAGETRRNPATLGASGLRETIHGIAASERGVLRLPETRDSIDRDGERHVLSRRRWPCEVIRVESDTAWAQFVVTTRVYDGVTERGIRLGDNVEDVLRAYGDSPRIVIARQGSYYIYDYLKIIFLIGTDGGVRTWILYAEG